MLSAAVLSACSRSALNLLDRHLYGVRKRCLFTTTATNLALPFGVCLGIVGGTGAWSTLMLLSPHVFVSAATIQLVSYAYAASFRRSTVLDVALYTKIGELLIPLGLLPWTGRWRVEDYLFYTGAFLASIPLWLRGTRRAWSWAAVSVVGMTVIQAIIFHVFPVDHVGSGLQALFGFHTSVLGWRLLFALAVLPFLRTRESEPFTSQDVLPILGRSVCFLMTQLTFFWALTGSKPYLVWPILNATSVLSSLLAVPVLGEPVKRSELMYLALLSGIITTRLLL